jgi:hypothetical protein
MANDSAKAEATLLFAPNLIHRPKTSLDVDFMGPNNAPA